jgi:electron transport complex protein RnfG
MARKGDVREFLAIAANLFVICLLAAGVLGLVFMHTEAARQKNEREHLESSMRRYLDVAPERMEQVRFARIWRYLVQDPESGAMRHVGYLAPTADGYVLLVLDPEGEMVRHADVPATDLEAEAAREAALGRALPAGLAHQQADEYILALDHGKRLADFVRGRTQGFKTWIHMLVALGPDQAVRGVEILEHEEDPGLGAEIEQDRFRNQFRGRTLAELQALQVVKTPLPEDYAACLEGPGPCPRWEDEPVHAVTGATISSNRVTHGVRRVVRDYLRRMETLRRAAAANGIQLLLGKEQGA